MMAALRRYLGLHARNFGGALGRLAGQPFATAMTVLVIAIAIALPAGLRVLVNNVGALSGGWQGAADFSVYLEAGVSADRAREIADGVAERDDVETVELITSDAALAAFRARSGFGETLDALEHNPLPHTLVVRPASGAASDVEAIAAALEAVPDVEIVQLDTEWVERLRAILALVARVVDVVTVLLGAGVVLVIGNTIRLEINNRSVEIEVTKLVGGTDGFIRRPFLYLGLCYGLAGALVALLVVGVGLLLLGAPVRAVAALYGSGFTLTRLSLSESGVLLLGGAVLGWAGAGLAAARHLKAIEPK